MSIYYPDLPLTEFPDRIDGRYLMVDPSTTDDMAAIALYNSYIDSGDMESAIKVLEDNPRLQKMFFNADKWNRHDDMIIALEKFFYEDVDQYLMNIVNWCGEWDDGTAYHKYDVVYYIHDEAEETFMAICDVPAGIEPTNINYFVPITLRGQKGASGAGLSWHGAWKNYIQFYKDDCACYNGKLYAALQDSMGEQPDISPAYWEEIFALDASSLTGVVAVVNGGTGLDHLDAGYVLEGNGTLPMVGHKIATTQPTASNTDLLTSGLAYAALYAKADKAVIVNVTAPASGWVDFEQELTVKGVTTTNVVIMSLNQNATKDQREVCWNATISPTVQSANKVRIVCDGLLPQIDLPLTFAIMGEEGTLQSESIKESLAQIETNDANIQALNSVVDNFKASVASDTADQAVRDAGQDAAIMLRASALRGAVTGNPVTTTDMDTNGGTISSLIVNGRTVQSGSGEPSPSNICMLTGVGGYDASITVNGSEDWLVGTQGAMTYYYIKTANAVVPGNSSSVYSTCLLSNGLSANPGSASAPRPCGYVYEGNGTNAGMLLFRYAPDDDSIDTVDKFKAWLAEHPITVWYQSKNYNVSNAVYVSAQIQSDNNYYGYAGGLTSPLFAGDYIDLTVKTVNHNNAYVLLTGEEQFSQVENDDWFAVRYSVADTTSAGKIETGGLPICNMLSSVPNTATGFITGDDTYNFIMYLPKSDYSNVTEFKAFLRTMYQAGTPMQIVYALAGTHATNVDVADIPVQYNDVTIKSDGELKVTYGRDLTAAIDEINRKLDALLN